MKNAILLGTFDGLHIGHRAVIKNIFGYNSTAVTFSLPPKMYLENGIGLLMLPEDRFEAMRELGVNNIETLDFADVRDIIPEEFLKKISKKYNPDLICCGFNYRFGKNAHGDSELLKNYCKNHDIRFVCEDEISLYGKTVSSSYIRSLLSDGDIDTVNRLIYRPFGFTSEVIHGDKRGRTIGFPTVNQLFPELLIKPRFGVYESEVIFQGKTYRSITNIGMRPTFETPKVTAETNIFDFSGDIYDKKIRLQLKHFLRDEKKFGSISELKEAIDADIKSVK